LDKYSSVLTETGVFIVRMYVLDQGKVKWRPSKMFEIIENNFDIVEKCQYDKSGAMVIVFQPRKAARH
jgi:hypothetical protein